MTKIFDPDSPGSNPWLELLADNPAPPPSGLGDIFGASPPQINALLGINAAFNNSRRRADWNARFAHWEKPASVSEAGTIERARSLVGNVVAGNDWLRAQGVTVAGQGSYHNHTNVRTEADIDLRIVHPSLFILYADNVHVPSAERILAYSDAPLTFGQIFNGLRASLATDLRARCGAANVEVGNKAIRIKGVTGSRAEVDVVPAVRFHYVTWLPAASKYNTIEGVAILGLDGRWTLNFPDQHATNGIEKRSRTACRFKRMVRVFKRLRSDMADRGLLSNKVPSFLVECLVYAVENSYFGVESDDRYDRVRRIAHRMRDLLTDASTAALLLEINQVKWLFHSEQSWSHSDALAFANAAVMHLGDA